MNCLDADDPEQKSAACLLADRNKVLREYGSSRSTSGMIFYHLGFNWALGNSTSPDRPMFLHVASLSFHYRPDEGSSRHSLIWFRDLGAGKLLEELFRDVWQPQIIAFVSPAATAVGQPPRRRLHARRGGGTRLSGATATTTGSRSIRSRGATSNRSGS